MAARSRAETATSPVAQHEVELLCLRASPPDTVGVASDQDPQALEPPDFFRFVRYASVLHHM